MRSINIINFGSLNLDHVYSVEHFVQPGETMKSNSYRLCCGGKGLNQSIAAARAGGTVIHAGMLGAGGEPLLHCLAESGVCTDYLLQTKTPQGHTVIQVAESGENSIILCPGSNFELTGEYINGIFNKISPPGFLLVQNEISEVPYLIHRAAGLGYQVVFNASPFEDSLLKLDYRDVTWLMINEIEGAQLSGGTKPEAILSRLQKRYPHLGIVLTLGKAGSICVRGDLRVERGIIPLPVADTTAAGDTFTGYFIALLAQGASEEEAVTTATAASALAVTKPGAAPSIPNRDDVQTLLKETELRRN